MENSANQQDREKKEMERKMKFLLKVDSTQPLDVENGETV